MTLLNPWTPTRHLYLYPPAQPMRERMPMSTTNEARSCLFPALKHAVPPGMHAGQVDAACPALVRFPDGSCVIATGHRVERHRRILDYILGLHRGLAAGEEFIFFIDLKAGARTIYGSRSLYPRLANELVEMTGIRLSYYKSTEDAAAMAPPNVADSLFTLFIQSFEPGTDRLIDALLRRRGDDPDAFAGLAVVRLGRVYARHLSDDMQVRYSNALDEIFQMSAVGASLARAFLSHRAYPSVQHAWQRRPLQEVLDEIGAPTGAGRDRAIAKLQSDDAPHLANLGITFSRGSRGKLFVDYVALAGDPPAITSSATS